MKLVTWIWHEIKCKSNRMRNESPKGIVYLYHKTYFFIRNYIKKLCNIKHREEDRIRHFTIKNTIFNPKDKFWGKFPSKCQPSKNKLSTKSSKKIFFKLSNKILNSIMSSSIMFLLIRFCKLHPTFVKVQFFR